MVYRLTITIIMAFQIHNAEGKAIGLNLLDAEAAQFWNKEVHPKEYAYPFEDEGYFPLNWFDVIGWHIDTNSANYYKRYDGTMNWNMVRESILIGAINILHDTVENIERIRTLYKPFMDLITEWESKGYQPIKLKD